MFIICYPGRAREPEKDSEKPFEGMIKWEK